MLRLLLRACAFRPLKRGLRHAWWHLRRGSISNPPLPASVRSVLFVCLGNICRSPFAEVTAAKRSAQDGPETVCFASAGIRTKQAAEPPEEAHRTAEAFGVSLALHRPRTLTRALMDAHDMIVVMESSQQDLLRTMYPDLRDRVFLLPMFDEAASGIDRCVIEDPFGLPRAAYEECYRRIDRAVATLLATLTDPGKAGRAERSRRSA